MITDWIRALTEPRLLGGLAFGVACLLVLAWCEHWRKGCER